MAFVDPQKRGWVRMLLLGSACCKNRLKTVTAPPPMSHAELIQWQMKTQSALPAKEHHPTQHNHPYTLQTMGHIQGPKQRFEASILNLQIFCLLTQPIKACCVFRNPRASS
jgi:hypothetical protein